MFSIIPVITAAINWVPRVIRWLALSTKLRRTCMSPSRQAPIIHVNVPRLQWKTLYALCWLFSPCCILLMAYWYSLDILLVPTVEDNSLLHVTAYDMTTVPL